MAWTRLSHSVISDSSRTPGLIGSECQSFALSNQPSECQFPHGTIVANGISNIYDWKRKFRSCTLRFEGGTSRDFGSYCRESEGRSADRRPLEDVNDGQVLPARHFNLPSKNQEFTWPSLRIMHRAPLEELQERDQKKKNIVFSSYLWLCLSVLLLGLLFNIFLPLPSYVTRKKQQHFDSDEA